MSKRREKGLTGRQFFSGVGSGFGALRNKETRNLSEFRGRYKAASRTLGDTLNKIESGKKQESLETLELMRGDDDVFEAYIASVVRGGGSRAEKEAALMKFNSDRFGSEDSSTAGQDQARRESVALMDRFTGEAGKGTVAQLIAQREAASATTFGNHAGSDNIAGYAEQLESTGASSFLRTRAALDMKDAQKKVGRLDTGGGSSAEMIGLMQKLRDDPTYTREMFENDMIDSAIKKNGPQAIIGQDHNGTVKFAKRIKERLAEAQKSGNIKELGREIGYLHGIYDSVTYGSVENKADIADQVLNAVVYTDDNGKEYTGKDLIDDYKNKDGAIIDPQISQELIKAHDSVYRSWQQSELDNEGNPIGAPPKPKPE